MCYNISICFEHLEWNYHYQRDKQYANCIPRELTRTLTIMDYSYSEKKEFNTLSEARKYAYESLENILTEDVHSNGEYCYIFFSSNGLCDDNKYIDELIYKEKYEWKSIARAVKKRKSTGRCIYVRDVYMRFYMYGISAKCNSIERVIQRIKEQISDKKWKVVTVGISSGGYMSVIVGMAIGAYKIFNISGQYSLKEQIPQYYDEFICINPLYGNIIELVKEYNQLSDTDKAGIYYLCPIGCNHDREQYNMVKDYPCVMAFLFPDKIHAATVYPFNFPDLLTKSRKKMERLYQRYDGKIIDKNVFLLRTITIKGVAEFIKRALKAKFNVNGMKKVWDVK